MEVLDPRYKVEYFRNLKWQPEWIDTAEAITRKAFEKYRVAGDSSEVDEDGAGDTEPEVRLFFHSYCMTLLTIYSPLSTHGALVCRSLQTLLPTSGADPSRNSHPAALSKNLLGTCLRRQKRWTTVKS